VKLAFAYDMDAIRGPTGVTRHAMAQLERLAKRPEIELTLVSGRISEPDGLAYWERFDGQRQRELPISTRDALRVWRMANWPPIEWWTGSVDWVYAPAEYFVATKKARRAVTSHDVLQDLRYGSPRRIELLRKVFTTADLILSVSHFNTNQLLDAFPECRGRVAHVPNGADDLFFEAAREDEIASANAALGLNIGMPYLLSVANFQERKNLVRLLEGVGQLEEVSRGELAIVLVGTGSAAETARVRSAAGLLGPKAVVRFVGYRQGVELRALYAGAMALVFASLCESFGIPAVEAMAQACPVALADSTALPEIGGEAGWYFDASKPESIAKTVGSLLGEAEERTRRISRGLEIAAGYRWDEANRCLMTALTSN
jgi:glycosyltransferase involved in cell wall biosynthesis